MYNTHLGIHKTQNRSACPHCRGEGDMQGMLHCCHLQDVHHQHTHNIHITFPPVRIVIVFVRSVLYQQSVDKGGSLQLIGAEGTQDLWFPDLLSLVRASKITVGRKKRVTIWKGFN